MKQLSLTPVLLLLLGVLACQPAGDQTQTSSEPSAPTEEEVIAHGEYLVNILGCDDCHTPKMMTDQGPVPDHSRRFMGHPADSPLPEIPASVVGPNGWLLFANDLTAAVGPWGVSYSANLTPDPTGIGNWTEEQFRVSITQGKHKGLPNGRPLLPPMPWQGYSHLTDEDVHALFTFLQQVTPIANTVPAPQPPAQ